jgi:hypothetical protein
MPDKPLLPNESQLSMHKLPSHVASSAAGIIGATNGVLRQEGPEGEMLFSPSEPREFAISRQSLSHGLPINAEPQRSSTLIQTGRAAAGIVPGAFNPLWHNSTSRQITVPFSAAKKVNINN